MSKSGNVLRPRFFKELLPHKEVIVRSVPDKGSKFEGKFDTPGSPGHARIKRNTTELSLRDFIDSETLPDATMLGTQGANGTTPDAEVLKGLADLKAALAGRGLDTSVADQFAASIEALLAPESVTVEPEPTPAKVVARENLPHGWNFGRSASTLSQGVDIHEVAPTPQDLKALLGGKGTNLMGMANLGLPVPPGFTLSTELCAAYLEKAEFPKSFDGQLDGLLARLEKQHGKKFGDPADPLLVSVRSGAAVSCPGMMDTILNLGLNDKVVRALANEPEPKPEGETEEVKEERPRSEVLSEQISEIENSRMSRTVRDGLLETLNKELKEVQAVEAAAAEAAKPSDEEEAAARFVYDSYRRFIMMFGEVAMNVSAERFEDALAELKEEKSVKADTELTATDLKELVETFKKIYKNSTGTPFPQDAKEQLRLAVGAVFKSWNNERAIKYREINGIEGLQGTAVNVQAMVFGNKGPESGTGVCFTRDPATGKPGLYGEFLVNAQGEDVVAGIRTPMPISEMADVFPQAYQDLLKHCETLETHHRDMQDIEFTVEDGKLYMLQTRSGKRTGEAAINIAVDLANAGLVTKEEAIEGITPDHIAQALRPRFVDAGGSEGGSVELTKGIAASPGAAVGQAVFTTEAAIELNKKGIPCILVRRDTSPEDVGGMDAAEGILTSTGGKTSHAAVVARGWGKPCVTGCGDLKIDTRGKCFTTPSGAKISEGDWMSLNGATGEVVAGKRELVTPEIDGKLETLMAWIDERLATDVSVSAVSREDVFNGIYHGASGCAYRTDHMFFTSAGIRNTREMILADKPTQRREALGKHHQEWVEEFKGLFRESYGKPVSIRLLSATMDRFLPEDELVLRKVSDDLSVSLDKVKKRQWEFKSAYPELGLKGCLLAFTHPEIIEAQTRALVEAALEVKNEGIDVAPEIMIASVGTRAEFEHQRSLIANAAAAILNGRGETLELRIGVNIETPRAALVAGELAEKADFMVFDVDRLTSLTYGVSEGAADALNGAYEAKGLDESPGGSFDEKGVGRLMVLASKQARETSPEISLRMAAADTDPQGAIRFAVARSKVDGVLTLGGDLPTAKLVAFKAQQLGPQP